MTPVGRKFDDGHGSIGLMPELRDEPLLAVDDDVLILAGYERVDDKDFAQSSKVELGLHIPKVYIAGGGLQGVQMRNRFATLDIRSRHLCERLRAHTEVMH
jgi:hypothetical protein